MGWRLLTLPTRIRFRFVDIAIEMPRLDDLDLALESLVTRYGGLMLDESWAYAASQRWLVQAGAGGIVRLERPPPEALVARFRPAPLPTPERFRWIRNRILAVLLSIAGVLGLAGLVAWRLTGDADYFFSGAFYAVLVAGAGGGALVAAGHRIAQNGSGQGPWADGGRP